ncbi:hypothetical protein ACJX0J_010056, partial [Zea mays]
QQIQEVHNIQNFGRTILERYNIIFYSYEIIVSSTANKISGPGLYVCILKASITFHHTFATFYT